MSSTGIRRRSLRDLARLFPFFALGEISDSLSYDSDIDCTGRVILTVDLDGVEFFLDGCGVFKTSHKTTDITAVRPYEFYKHEALGALLLAVVAELNKGFM